MRSFLLFVCCFCFLGAAVYLAVLVVLKPAEIMATAYAVPGPTVYLSILEQGAKKGAILSSSDLSWVSHTAPERVEEFMTRANFLKIEQPYFALKHAVQSGKLLKINDFLWPDDLHYLANILQFGYRAVEVRFKEGVRGKQGLPNGSYVDLMLKINPGKLRASRKPKAQSLVVVKYVRVLDGHYTQDENVVVILELTEQQTEIISLSQSLGLLSVLLRPNGEVTADPGFDTKILQKLASLQLVGRLPDDSQIVRSIIIQRGENITVLDAEAHGNGRNTTQIVSEISRKVFR